MPNLFDKEYANLKREFTIANRPFHEIITRLDALMMVLKSCKGRSCTHPWETLHPKGNVATLTDSLRPSYDAFYKEQPKVHFTKCELGYIKESEGPMDVVPFGASSREEWKAELRKKGAPVHFRYQGEFSIWT
jgi:hypothetical protein